MAQWVNRLRNNIFNRQAGWQEGRRNTGKFRVFASFNQDTASL